MRNSLTMLGLAGILLMAGCSSSTTEENAKSATDSKNVNSVTANANTAVITNGMTVAPLQPGNENATVATSTDGLKGAAANRLDGRVQAMREADTRPANFDPVAIALRNAKPAPENSTFASFLTDAGYEIRTFKNHPQILRVEKRIDGRNQTMKIFLRNGKVVETAGERIPVLSLASTVNILDVAGVKPAAPSQPAGDVPTKKSSN